MKHFETRAVHAGHSTQDAQGAVKPALHRASTFAFPSAENGAAHMEAAYGVPGVTAPDSGYIYSRLHNPTIAAAETRLAALDQADSSALFASGMAAISTALLAGAGPERPVWYANPVYGGTEHFVREILPTWGIGTRALASLDQLEALHTSTGELPGIVYLETPANPTMQLHRIATAVDFARKYSTAEHPVYVYVDNTYLGPVMQRPLECGTDLVLYSATKYLGGHSDLVAGAVSGKQAVVDAVRSYRHFLGGTITPDSAWMLMRSMETLHLRTERQAQNTEAVAAFLRQHPAVQQLHSALTQDLSPEAEAIAQAQMQGRGSMLAFTVAGGRNEAFTVLNALRVFTLAVSLGSTESLAEHPASMTHAGVPGHEKELYGIHENLIRLSIGVEHVEDLMDDLRQALASLPAADPFEPASAPALSGMGKN